MQAKMEISVQNQGIVESVKLPMAERGGFEPPIGLRLCRISSAVLSTAQPPLQPTEIIKYSGRNRKQQKLKPRDFSNSSPVHEFRRGWLHFTCKPEPMAFPLDGTMVKLVC